MTDYIKHVSNAYRRNPWGAFLSTFMFVLMVLLGKAYVYMAEVAEPISHEMSISLDHIIENELAKND